jgi:hypothetical protein
LTDATGKRERESEVFRGGAIKGGSLMEMIDVLVWTDGASGRYVSDGFGVDDNDGGDGK